MVSFQNRKISILLFIITIFNVCKANAQISAISASEQAILFKKIFSYVKTLEEAENPVVLMVYEDPEQYPADLVSAFTKESIRVLSATPGNIENIKEEVQIIYIAPGVSQKGLTKLFSLKNKLLISGNPDYIIEGKASLGVGKDVEEERYKILINLSTLARNSHEVASELISLAKVIK